MVRILDLRWGIHLATDRRRVFSISLWRCISRHLSRVEAIRLGSRMLIISKDPVTILDFARHVSQG